MYKENIMIKKLLAVLLVTTSFSVLADLKPLSNEELSDTYGRDGLLQLYNVDDVNNNELRDKLTEINNIWRNIFSIDDVRRTVLYNNGRTTVNADGSITMTIDRALNVEYNNIRVGNTDQPSLGSIKITNLELKGDATIHGISPLNLGIK